MPSPAARRIKGQVEGLQFTASLGACAPGVARRLAAMRRERFAERLWAKDATLWKSLETTAREIQNRLGWLTVIPSMQRDCSLLISFAEEVRQAGFTHAVLLGMGGSSLAADVCRQTFGSAPGFLKLEVLDSTDPNIIQELTRKLPLARTLFLVSTKSGTTTETLCFFRYFFDQVHRRKPERAGENFVAITDPGSSLVAIGAEQGFRRTFLNPPDIGGRFSALSYFGLVPAALLGIDIRKLLARAAALLPATGGPMATEENPGIQLGAILGEMGVCGRDKVTFALPPRLAAFGAWVEQLLAESTGKEGSRALLPIDGEPLASVSVYGDDRVFVQMRLQASSIAGDASAASKLKRLETAGHPVLRIVCRDVYDLGLEFFRWEIATAVAAAILHVNAFDEPNVQESKDNTRRLLKQFETEGTLPEGTPVLRESGIAVYGATNSGAARKKSAAREKAPEALLDLLRSHYGEAKPGDYLALLAYLTPTAGCQRWLQKIRTLLHTKLGIATTVGYGPRYLHSTGQFHKGGPPTGVFVELTASESAKVPIPGLAYTFGTLQRAQALGDFEALKSRSRPILRLDLGSKEEAGLKHLARWTEQCLGRSAGSRAKITSQRKQKPWRR